MNNPYDLTESFNPLSRFRSYVIKHVIVGFKYTEDACKFEITGDIGPSGSFVGNTIDVSDNPDPNSKNFCGPGIVFINELEDETFVVYDSETKWDFFTETDSTTGRYTGYIHVQDRIGMLFAHKIKEYCDLLEMSLGHIVFSWKTYFLGINEKGDDEIITTNPMIFHVTDYAQSLAAEIGRANILNIVSAYNTFGQLPQFSKMYQTTLTHSDGNVQEEIPMAENSNAELISRQEEDKNNLEKRKRRLDKSKPMKTIQDVFLSLQTEMTEQALAAKNQVQEWQSIINDRYTKKLLPPEQYIQELPLRYTIGFDGSYDSIKVDNRNLPFEQPEQDQRLEGIRSLPFHLGTTLTKAIQMIMGLSKDVGKMLNKIPAEGFRITTTTIRECDGKYNIHTNVNKYIIPHNTVDDIDTAPGDNIINGPLELYYLDGKNGRGRDVISVAYHSHVTPHHIHLEKEVEDSDDIGVVYGNREPISVQRAPINGNDNFFGFGFSGNRALTNTFTTSGVESSDSASSIRTHMQASFVKQSTSYRIKIVGNPYLLNDINRNPLDVKDNVGEGDNTVRWQYILYNKPEHQPMYLKLSVFLRDEAYLAGLNSKDIPDTYFYSGNLHITSISNKYSRNAFIQVIEGVRTEDNI